MHNSSNVSYIKKLNHSIFFTIKPRFQGLSSIHFLEKERQWGEGLVNLETRLLHILTLREVVRKEALLVIDTSRKKISDII